jgi:hypothetical protein
VDGSRFPVFQCLNPSCAVELGDGEGITKIAMTWAVGSEGRVIDPAQSDGDS